MQIVIEMSETSGCVRVTDDESVQEQYLHVKDDKVYAVAYSDKQGIWEGIEYPDMPKLSDTELGSVLFTSDNFAALTYDEDEKAYIIGALRMEFADGNLVYLSRTGSEEKIVISNIGSTEVEVPEYTITEAPDLDNSGNGGSCAP